MVGGARGVEGWMCGMEAISMSRNFSPGMKDTSYPILLPHIITIYADARALSFNEVDWRWQDPWIIIDSMLVTLR